MGPFLFDSVVVMDLNPRVPWCSTAPRSGAGRRRARRADGPEYQRGMSGAAANHPTLSAISNKRAPHGAFFLAREV